MPGFPVCRYCYSPWKIWIKLCQFYNRYLEVFFAKLAELVSSSPVVVIVICLVIIAALTSGLAFMKTENRTEELYIPQESESITNLEKAKDLGFFRPLRSTEVIFLKKNGETILTKECLQDLLNLHNVITNITGYIELCLPLGNMPVATSTRECVVRNVLSIFDYDSRNFVDILSKVNAEETIKGVSLDGVIGSISRNSSKLITSAKALRLVYSMRGNDLGEEPQDDILDWEKEFLNQMKKSGASRAQGCSASLYYTTTRSIDDAIVESTGSDIKLISITFTIMISFACFMLAKYRNPLTGHGLLAMSGVMCVGFGIVCAFGLAMYCGVPFISIVGILPFLILGVGIDDMFIIVDELDRIRADQPIPARLSSVMRRIGPAITMTTMTDLLAFAVGTTSRFPSVVHFCTYAALAISFAFLFLVTIFIAYMTYDCRRMNAGYRDMAPCLKAPPAPARPDGSPRRWDEPVTQTSNKIMEVWGKILMKPLTKGLVVVLSLALLAIGIYGSTSISEEFDRKDLAKDGSEFSNFLETLETYFTEDLKVDVILEPGLNYSDAKTLEKIEHLSDIITSNKYYRPRIISWLNEYKQWSMARNISNNSGISTSSLKRFLVKVPRFHADVTFTKDNRSIEASRFYCFMNKTRSSIFQRDGMTSLRRDLNEKSDLAVFASNENFIFFEQYVLIFSETLRNVGLAAAAIFIITTVFLVNPLVVFLVLVSFVSLIFELFGLMYVWDVSLNSISMINLVMAIGFAVDYSAHVAHFFVFSHKNTPEEKVIESLKTVGASVFMGGFSTFLGMVVTAFASAEIFRIFFKMFFGIVVLGLLHGLCFLPVWLAIICRQNINVELHRVGDSDGHSSSNTGAPANLPTRDNKAKAKEDNEAKDEAKIEPTGDTKFSNIGEHTNVAISSDDIDQEGRIEGTTNEATGAMKVNQPARMETKM